MYSFGLNGLFTFVLPIWIVIRVFTIIKKRKIGIDFNIVDEIFTNLFVIYLFVLIGITILPIYVDGMPYLEELSFIERCRVNLVPFIHYFKNGIFSISIIRNIVGNLLLLLPFILYLCVKYEKMRNLKSSAIIALVISLSIELTQLVTNVLCISYGRAVDVEDLILNTIGGIIGWYIFKLIYKGKIKNIVDKIYCEQNEQE